MNSYEVLYILNSEQDDETIAAQAEKFNALVAANGGEVLKTDMWGRRRLAYPIQFKNEGYYVLMNIKAGPELPAELERNFRISDEVMRYIVVRQELRRKEAYAMNKCILIGNLTKDPDLKTLPSTGTSVCNFTVAVTRRFANQQGEREVDFIPVVVWRTQAENCAKYLRKGSQVAVWGSIQTRTYEAQDKTRRYVTEVVAEEVKFLNRTVGKGEDSGASGSSGQAGQAGKRHGEEFDNAADMQEIDEDMPF